MENESVMKRLDLSLLRMLRFLRLLRILPMARLMKFVSELNVIVLSVVNSLRSLGWTLLLLLILMYTLGVLFTQVVLSYRLGHFSTPSKEGAEAVTKWWGTLPRSVLSLYEAIMGGVDWDDVIMPLADYISPVCAVFFALYIAFALLAMMNVITGVFVDSALKNAELEKETDFLRVCSNIFCCLADSDGNISYQEYEEQLDEPELNEYVKYFGIEPEDAKLLFRLLDKEDCGELPLQELFEGLLRLRSNARFIDVQRLEHLTNLRNSQWQVWANNMEDNMFLLGAGIQDIGKPNRGSAHFPLDPSVPTPPRPRRNRQSKADPPLALWHPFGVPK